VMCLCWQSGLNVVMCLCWQSGLNVVMCLCWQSSASGGNHIIPTAKNVASGKVLEWDPGKPLGMGHTGHGREGTGEIGL
jgi:hypothetical protein